MHTTKPLSSTRDAVEPHSQIALLCDGDRRDRYAARYETTVGLLDVVCLKEADPSRTSLVVIDTATPPGHHFLLQLNAPVLLSPELLSQSGVASSLPGTLDWAPLMPWASSNDVKAGAALVRQGRMGPIWHGYLRTGVGEPPHPMWETDEWWALSVIEAVFGGLTVSEKLTGATVVALRVLARTPTALCVLYTLDDGAAILQTVAPSLSLGLPWLSIQLLGKNGSVHVNGDFAPANIAEWDSTNQTFTFRASQVSKPNIQAADSTKGGWDIVALLGSMLNESQASRSEARVQATRLGAVLANAEL